MPRNPRPVRARRAHERQYERELRREILDPLFQGLRAGLGEATAVTQVYRAIDDAVEAAAVRGVPIDFIREHFDKVRGYHRRRLIETFHAALGVDISFLLTRPEVMQFIDRKIAENVSLIKTIPQRMHDSLTDRLRSEFRDAPFDRQKLSKILAEEYASTGYNLRRIARDQTTKTIGNLTEIRQRQLGVQGYRWGTSADEAVRPTHRENGGKMFRWDQPPANGTGPPGHDIQCRCVAYPVLLKADRDRLKAMAGQKTPSAPKNKPPATVPKPAPQKSPKPKKTPDPELPPDPFGDFSKQFESPKGRMTEKAIEARKKKYLRFRDRAKKQGTFVTEEIADNSDNPFRYHLQRDLNQKLRRGEALDATETALHNQRVQSCKPGSTGVSWRGIRLRRTDLPKAGQNWQYGGMDSWSDRLGVAQQYAGKKKPGEDLSRVVLRGNIRKGVRRVELGDHVDWGNFLNEQQFHPETSMRVLRVTQANWTQREKYGIDYLVDVDIGG